MCIAVAFVANVVVVLVSFVANVDVVLISFVANLVLVCVSMHSYGTCSECCSGVGFRVCLWHLC